MIHAQQFTTNPLNITNN